MGRRPTPRQDRADPGPALRDQIRDHALGLGFDAVGFAPADLGDQPRQALAAYLAAGHHGDMGWMAETAERRSSLTSLWPEARSAIVVGMNYGPGRDPLAVLAEPQRGYVSAYARNRDYHDTLKKRLRQLAEWLHRLHGAGVKLFVDTAPVMEKPLAQRAGLGWQGKHTNLVSRQFGSWLFLGELVTDLDLGPSEGEQDHCGGCTRCLAACPTQAFPAPYQLDARRCIAYLTIEHKGSIPVEFRPLIGNRIYGCDDCLAVCPWNKFAKAVRQADFLPRIELTAPRLAELAGLDDAGFREFFSGSPIKRIGRDRFIRNVLIAIGNSGDPALAAVADPLRQDPSAIVAEAADWAVAQLVLSTKDAYVTLTS